MVLRTMLKREELCAGQQAFAELHALPAVVSKLVPMDIYNFFSSL